MRVLFVHNFYREPGGEDRSYLEERALVEAAGHEVWRYTAHNDSIDRRSRLAVAGGTIWNDRARREVRDLVRRHRIDVVHLQNTFPLISPAAAHGARGGGAAVVQSIRDWRLACVNGLFWRDGASCERCSGRFAPWAGVRFGCYRGSRAASAVVAGSIAAHRSIGTWARKVDLFICPTEFAKRKIVEAAALPEERIAVKPNVTRRGDPGDGSGDFVLFVGRLAPGKGIETLLRGWKAVDPGVLLRIAGDGPLAPLVERAATERTNVEWLGRRPHAEVGRLMGEAALLVFPSESPELFGRVAMEAFARGTPVLVADTEAIGSLVTPGVTGMRFPAGDAAALAREIRGAFAEPGRLREMRTGALAEYEARYSPEENLRTLLDIYDRAIRLSGRGTS